ncbi:MAG: flagellar protein FlgN [Gammaproteobacteria bacterium]|jgi:flagella synthesis protein FlgN|nr:flagellar protein FlgN [Gammaproteobacteria bacterium]
MPDTQLLASLETDIETCTRLTELLEQEFVALNERRLDELQALLADKQPLLESLAQHASQRSQILLEQGQSADADGFAALASQSPLRERLQDAHQRLHGLMEKCQTANLRNGRLIRTNQVSIGKALNIIRGSDGPALYDSSGSTAYKGMQRSFTRA